MRTSLAAKRVYISYFPTEIGGDCGVAFKGPLNFGRDQANLVVSIPIGIVETKENTMPILPNTSRLAALAPPVAGVMCFAVPAMPVEWARVYAAAWAATRAYEVQVRAAAEVQAARELARALAALN
jgi:hypothetical protein